MSGGINGSPWWLVAGSAVCVVGLALVVRRRYGKISRLSWLDAAMGGSSIGAVAAALDVPDQ